MRTHIKVSTFILFFLLGVAVIVPFFYKAVYDPIHRALNLKEDEKRIGDFWGTFPGPFVGHYNPILREKNPAGRDTSEITWFYGPIQYVITLPLTIMTSCRSIGVIWLVCNYIFLISAFLFTMRMLKDLPFRYKLLIAFLWIGYWPLYNGVQQEVIEIFEFFMLLLSIYLLYRKRETLAGISLGITAMVKLLPIIFLPYLVIKRKFKAATAMFITVLLIAIAAQFTLGWQNNGTLAHFKREARGGDNTTSAWSHQTVSAAVWRIFSIKDYSIYRVWFPAPSNPRAAKVTTLFLQIIILISAVAMLYKNKRKKETDIECGIFAVLMILIAPHGEPYYLIFNLIGYSFAVKYLYEKRYVFGAVLLGISYFISGYINQIRWFDIILGNYIERNTFFYFLSFPAYGTILLFVLLLMLYKRSLDKI